MSDTVLTSAGGGTWLRGAVISGEHAKHRLVILASLLIPAVSFDLYILAQCVLLLIAYGDRFEINGQARVVVAIIAFVIVTSALRFVTSFSPNPRDFKEAFRFVPVLMLVSYRHRMRSLALEDLLWVFSFYAVVDAAVSVLQFLKLDMFGVVSRLAHLYGTEGHVAKSLGLRLRTIGFSAGPGQHGAMCSILYVFFLSALLLPVGSPRRALLGIFSSAASVLLAQSQTGMVVIGLGTLVTTFTFLVLGRRNQRRAAAALLLVLGVAFGAVYLLLMSQLRYVRLLFIYGLERASYQRRTAKWVDFLRLSVGFPYWLPIGHGKDFFGRESRAMDNEYVYFLSVYGWVFTAVGLGAVLTFLARMLAAGRAGLARRSSAVLFFVVAAGMVLAWPSAFVLDVRILFLVALLLVLRSHEQEDSRHARAPAV